MWYERSVTKAIFLALVLLVLLTGAFALRLAWENTPEAEAQGAIQQPGPIQEPGPQQKGGQLMNAGGSADGPAPVMLGGGCLTELPIERDGACYR